MDLLVRLYDLPELAPALQQAREGGVEIRRALTPEKRLVARWVAEQFSAGWASECEAAFARLPVACWIAVRSGELCGFAAYEATCRGFLGPLGVEPTFRGRHIGEALLLAALHAMWVEGYAYAIIGSAGPVEFFARVAGAMPIAGSERGIYCGMLKQ